MIHTLVVASGNRSKVTELRALLAGLPVRLVAMDEVLRPPPRVVEDGATFADNAVKKARAIAAACLCLTIADDSGLEVDALDGRPGVRSARFAHERATDAENNAALVAALQATGDPAGIAHADAYTARFRCVLALVDPYSPAAEVALTEGVCEGAIASAARGSFGFGYDPLFLVKGHDKTMAELSEAEKNSLSHRAPRLPRAPSRVAADPRCPRGPRRPPRAGRPGRDERGGAEPEGVRAWLRDARPLRQRALRERVAALLRRADGREDAAAAPGRRPRRLDHVHALLPERAPPRVRLRARGHGLARRPRAGGFHLVVLLLPLLVLPIHIGPAQVALLGHGERPVLGLLVVLGWTVGLPFFVVGATAPLLQKWFSQIGHPAGSDPYFLYGASNLGSLVGLAAYPLLLEPFLGLHLQASSWRWGYLGLVLLVGSAAVTTIRRAQPPPVTPTESPVAAAIPWARRVRWVVLAFVPSSFLLGVTSYITTDVAGIPLFWVLPLGLYLATFTLVFARRPPLPHATVVRILPFGLTATVMLLLTQALTPILLIVTVHLATLFLASMACHGELARDRPSPTHLTEFFLWVSVGGVLGGIANGLVAPAVFDGIVEYPLVMVLAAFFGRVPEKAGRPARGDWAFGLAVGGGTLALVLFGKAMHFASDGPLTALLFGPPLLATYAQLGRPVRFALGLAGVLLGGNAYSGVTGTTLVATRNFFGVVRVLRDPSGQFVQFVHGNTIHGRQRTDPASKDEPSGYYTRIGPLAQVFGELHASHPAASNVAVIGLGAGSMAAYAQPDERWTFYEINPAVVSIATNPAYFTLLRDAFGDSSRLSIVVGDARLRLADVPDGAYDLLVVDAFSSDAIPAHLLTREAIALYEQKLSAHGVLALHISNRYLNLAPVLASLATDAGLSGYLRQDRSASDATAGSIGWTPSIWTVLRRPGDAAPVVSQDARWERFPLRLEPPWTDDVSDLVRAYRWQ